MKIIKSSITWYISEIDPDKIQIGTKANAGNNDFTKLSDLYAVNRKIESALIAGRMELENKLSGH